jgi:uncharacterized protein (TIGR03066 family)
MKTIATLILSVTAIILAFNVAKAEDKTIDKAKLVGKWKVVTIDGNAPQVNLTYEYTKDGKFTLAYEKDGKTGKGEGTYSVDGDKLNSVIIRGDKENKITDTITSLTDKDLTITKSDGKKFVLEKAK